MRLMKGNQIKVKDFAVTSTTIHLTAGLEMIVDIGMKKHQAAGQGQNVIDRVATSHTRIFARTSLNFGPAIFGSTNQQNHD